MTVDGTSEVGGPAPTAARQGRHKQRYGEGGERLVAGCIPIRLKGSGSSVEDVEIVLISSRGGKGFCLPKGGWEDDETVEAAALRETVEEAGVRGVLQEPILGKFPFSSKHLSRNGIETPHGGRCIAHVYIMHVQEELDVWPESQERQRHWLSPTEAASRCKHDWMRDAIHVWMRQQGWESAVSAAASCCPAPETASASTETTASARAGVCSGPSCASEPPAEVTGSSTVAPVGSTTRGGDVPAAISQVAASACAAGPGSSSASGGNSGG